MATHLCTNPNCKYDFIRPHYHAYKFVPLASDTEKLKKAELKALD